MCAKSPRQDEIDRSVIVWRAKGEEEALSSFRGTAMNYSHSRQLYDRAKVIPGRSMTRSKAPGRLFDIEAGPLYAAEGQGAVLIDVDGNEYIDMLCGLGAISIGYGMTGGLPHAVYSLPHHTEVDTAEAVLEYVAPWATSCRFTKTGSEALQAAYMVAKAVRKERAESSSRVLVGAASYHGWHEWTNHATRYPLDADLDALVADLERFRVFDPEPFAVFVEPPRWTSVNASWLQHVREFCTRTGALMVMDEMIYGGRWALGGATELCGVLPDLACFGKAIGNGAPIACVVGNEALDRYGDLASGTYSGEVSSLVSVVEVLDRYATEPVIETLWVRGRQLQEGLLAAVQAWNVADAATESRGITARGPVHLEGAPVHQRLRFADPRYGKLFAAAMAQRGVLWHPDCCNVCFAHSREQIDRVIEVAVASVSEVGDVR